MEHFQITIEQIPSRRYSKLDILERKNASIRCLSHRLWKVSEFIISCRVTKVASVDINSLWSRATYIRSILYGSNILSSFEMVKGYKTTIQDLPKSLVSDHLWENHKERAARPALQQQITSDTETRTTPWRTKCVLFQVRKIFGSWECATVKKTEPHMMLLSSRKDHSGLPTRAAYEDVRLIPDKALLKELYKADYIFPQSLLLMNENE